MLSVSLTGLRCQEIAGKMWSLGVSVRVFLEEISIWIHGLSKDSKLLFTAKVLGHHSSIESADEQKDEEGQIYSLLELGHPSFPAPGSQGFWFSDLRPQTGIHTISSPDSQAFRHGLDSTTSPRPPACRQQMVGLLSLCNHVRQFL